MDAKKIFSLSIVAVLLLPAIFVAFPLVAATITERPKVFYEDNYTDPITVPAGGEISIWTRDMTITGAQVWLWLSNSGSADANQNNGDRWYAGPFYVGDILNATPKPYTFTPASGNIGWPFTMEGRNYTFTVGNGWINGTVPYMVQGGNTTYWIKVTDVDPKTTPSIPSSDVGVSTNRIRFNGSFYMTPISGAPNTPVTVSGYALQADMTYNITQNDAFVANVSVVTHNESGWIWTGFTYTFPIMDLGNKYSGTDTSANVTVRVNNTAFICNFTEYYRVVYVPFSNGSMLPANHTGNYGLGQPLNVTFNTGQNYNVSLWWFPYNGQASIYLNSTLVAQNIALNGSGAVFNYTITIPQIPSGNYFFKVIDNNNVEYNFTVYVTLVPKITAVPNEGSCGDQVTLSFTNMADYVGNNITVYLGKSITAGEKVLLANITVPSSSFNITITVPHYIGGSNNIWLGYINGSTILHGPTLTSISTTFTVLPKVWVDPASFSNDGATFWVYGCGFEAGEGVGGYYVDIDNQGLAIGNQARVYPNATNGDIAVQLVKAGFRPGLHVVSFYNCNNGPSYSIYAYATFTVATTGDLVIGDLKNYMNSSFSSLNAKLVAIEDDIATVQTTLGTMQTSINNLDAKVVALQGNMATVQTILGQINGTVTAINGNVATIKTDVGTIKADVSAVKADTTTMKGFLPVDMTPVWIAVVLALIAAIASIYSIVVIRSKIAA